MQSCHGIGIVTVARESAGICDAAGAALNDGKTPFGQFLSVSRPFHRNPWDSLASNWTMGRLGGSLGLLVLVVVAMVVPRELGRGVGLLCAIAAVAAVARGVCSWRNLEDVSVTTGEVNPSFSPRIAGEVGEGGGSNKSEIEVQSSQFVSYCHCNCNPSFFPGLGEGTNSVLD